MRTKHKDFSVSRRSFIKEGAAIGVGATALAGLNAEEADAQARVRWDRVADVVIAGAGASGLCAAISAIDNGAAVIAIDENYDIGGHAMVSGGNVPLGGGHSLQKKYGIVDSADQVYLDHTDHLNPEYWHSDRSLVRVWADENAPTFEFLLENGVKFRDGMPGILLRPNSSVPSGSVRRLFTTQVFSNDLNETIAGSGGSGLVRALEASARSKKVEFLLRHKLAAIIREKPAAGKILGITARFEDKNVNIRARRGVVIATGGHSSNVKFRRIFDPRLTDEYQVAGEPWSRQSGDGERMALGLGASLWATGNQTTDAGSPITKTRHIGCRYGYQSLKWNPKSPLFERAGASGLTLLSFQNVILVNRVGVRFWNELDNSFRFYQACLGTNGSLGRDGEKESGGGPIWAIFDADAVAREKWNPTPPNIDPDGWFFSADTVGELAKKIANPYQYKPVPADALEETVTKYNSYVDLGKDPEFNKPTPMYKIQKPPFYAAWSTPILHDTLTGLKINGKCEVIDIEDKVIPGLYCAGESAGGFGLHGLPRVTVFGRIAGREAARRQS